MDALGFQVDKEIKTNKRQAVRSFQGTHGQLMLPGHQILDQVVIVVTAKGLAEGLVLLSFYLTFY